MKLLDCVKLAREEHPDSDWIDNGSEWWINDLYEAVKSAEKPDDQDYRYTGASIEVANQAKYNLHRCPHCGKGWKDSDDAGGGAD